KTWVGSSSRSGTGWVLSVLMSVLLGDVDVAEADVHVDRDVRVLVGGVEAVGHGALDARARARPLGALEVPADLSGADRDIDADRLVLGEAQLGRAGAYLHREVHGLSLGELEPAEVHDEVAEA